MIFMYIFEYKLQLLDIMKIFEIMKLEYFNKIWMIIMDIVPDWAQAGPTSSTTQSTGTSGTTQKGQVHLADLSQHIYHVLFLSSRTRGNKAYPLPQIEERLPG
jgi:hypothetical protein